MTKKPNPDEIEAELFKLLEDATSMQVGLADDDSEYDLNYISDKLKKISVYQERLSDIQMKLTRMSLEVIKMARATQGVLNLRERELKATDEYRDTPLNEKALWTANRLGEVGKEAETWRALSKMVSEIKDAVAERAGTMKRLDSDIRLHTRIYEARVAAGATSPASYTGHSTTEVDID